MKKNHSIIRITALLAAVMLLAGVPFSTAFADDDIIPVRDTEDFDMDPDDPALDIDPGQFAATFSLDADGGETDPDDPMNPVYSWFGVQGNNKGTVSFLKNKKKKRYEYRHLAKQKMYKCDTFQGACSHGKYSYHVLYNRKNNTGRVIKVSMKKHNVVKVSKVLPLDHGNDMTYDTKRNLLVVVHYQKHPKRLTLIDPKTLKVKKVVNVKTPTDAVGGAGADFCKSIGGYTGIGYDSQNDEYIASIMGCRHYAVIDPSTFKVNRVIIIRDPEPPYVRQGMTVKDGFIIRSFSAYNKKYNQNILFVYDFAGNFVKTCKLGSGYEIESVFFDGDKMYAATYRSYLKKKTKIVKVKVKGRKKKKKVRRTYYVLRRDNNIIRIKNY